jgi:hypothetical protein
MGVAAVVHLKVFPAKPYRRGERSVPNAAVMSDYASLGAPDPEEERDIDKLTIMETARPDSRERRLSFPQSVRDVVLGSSEIVSSRYLSVVSTTHIIFVNYSSYLFYRTFQMVDDVKYTVSHVVEPMERRFTKINKTLHQISENVKHEKQKRKAKDDSHLIPLESRSEEFSEAHDQVSGGSFSDSGLARKRYSRLRRWF